MYFYVDESFRDMGIGSKMFKMAKKIAKSHGSDIMVFDTLTPNLNGFYKNKVPLRCVKVN
jgi:ribosomal protein S18 acetylase RimI-like enzyme